MPKDRVLAMGLLSKYPEKSTVLKRFLTPHYGKPYTEAQKQHAVALWFTPELQTHWIMHQFRSYGVTDMRSMMRRFERMALHPDNEKYRYLGPQNLLHIGPQEVKAYYDRYTPNKGRLYHPSWTVPIFNDHRKQGWTLKEIAEHYGIPKISIQWVLRKGMFHSHPPVMRKWWLVKG